MDCVEHYEVDIGLVRLWCHRKLFIRHKWKNKIVLSLQGFEVCFNLNVQSCHHRKSHCGDKTIIRIFYIHNEIDYTDKMAFFIGLHCKFVNVSLFNLLDDCVRECTNLLALWPSRWTERLNVVSGTGNWCCLTDISLSSIEWGEWMINYICIFVLCVITHPCLNFNTLS